uniref:Uncharacterized protein n=1 Tax=Amphimedon queenslandica TaxID=400682 RepID=A0A1X7VAZ9_AMPQE
MCHHISSHMLLPLLLSLALHD